MEISSEIQSLQVMIVLVAAATSALLGVVAIGLWTRMLSTSGRASRRAQLAADQLESTTNQLKEYMGYIEQGAVGSQLFSSGVDSHQTPAAPETAPPATVPAAAGLDDRSEGPERSVADRLKEIINRRRLSRLAQDAARAGRPNA